MNRHMAGMKDGALRAMGVQWDQLAAKAFPKGEGLQRSRLVFVVDATYDDTEAEVSIRARLDTRELLVVRMRQKKVADSTSHSGRPERTRAHDERRNEPSHRSPRGRR